MIFFTYFFHFIFLNWTFLLKPIFHCEGKPFALGTGVGLDPQCHNSCIGHVHFMLFVSISFAIGSQRKCSLQWNMGFYISFLHFKLCIYSKNIILEGTMTHIFNSGLSLYLHDKTEHIWMTFCNLFYLILSNKN